MDRDVFELSVAAHEASHLVVAHVLGGEVYAGFVCVSGYGYNGHLGEAWFTQADPIKSATATLAGAVGGAFIVGADYSFIEASDLCKRDMKIEREANTGLVVTDWKIPVEPTERDLQAYVNGGNRIDVLYAWKDVMRVARSESEACDLFEAAQHAAMKLVVLNLTTIRALADVLQRKLVLTSEQMSGILGRPGAYGGVMGPLDGLCV